uniref:Nonstructural protein n=1 Tax=Physostegia virginiana fijivirus TaxID=3075966 RepID=A0AA96C4S7_9REOV|nr:nonstructural protein [Physostegia virginiana fijivirus]
MDCDRFLDMLFDDRSHTSFTTKVLRRIDREVGILECFESEDDALRWLYKFMVPDHFFSIDDEYIFPGHLGMKEYIGASTFDDIGYPNISLWADNRLKYLPKILWREMSDDFKLNWFLTMMSEDSNIVDTFATMLSDSLLFGAIKALIRDMGYTIRNRHKVIDFFIYLHGLNVSVLISKHLLKFRFVNYRNKAELRNFVANRLKPGLKCVFGTKALVDTLYRNVDPMVFFYYIVRSELDKTITKLRLLKRVL